MNAKNEPSATVFSAKILADTLFTEHKLNNDSNFLVAYSGGCDSQVLLHSLVELKKVYPINIVAAHFDHGMQADSIKWAQQCQIWAEEYGVEYVSARKVIRKQQGASLEAQGRTARYRWLDDICKPGQITLTAHHADDQAETFLLHLFQGKEIDQLAGIAPTRPLIFNSRNCLVRPLLGLCSEQLKAYAKTNHLQWIEDPSNMNLKFYRNYLRHELMPLLIKRRPTLTAELNSAAKACRNISIRQQKTYVSLLKRYASPTLRGVFCLQNPLNLVAIRNIDQYIFSGLVRCWIHAAGLQSPSSRQLATLYEQIIVRKASTAALKMGKVAVRYFNKHLFLTKIFSTGTLDDIKLDNTKWSLQSIDIPSSGINISTHDVKSGGLDKNALEGQALSLSWRKGGERITLANRRHSSAIKKLFQEKQIPRWERDNLPILMANGEVAWVPGIGPAGKFAQKKQQAGINIKFSLL